MIDPAVAGTVEFSTMSSGVGVISQAGSRHRCSPSGLQRTSPGAFLFYRLSNG